MSGKPQTLSKGQREEVSKILRNKIIKGCITGCVLIGIITGYSLWDIKNRLEEKVENLIASQFEEPHIKAVVENVAETKAESLLVMQINPEVQRFKNEIASQLTVLNSLVADTQNLKSLSDSTSQQILTILNSVRNSQQQIDEIKGKFTGLNSDLIKLEQGLVEIQYLTYKGRNSFPNPYHERIMAKLNELLIIAIPNLDERAQFVRELEKFQPNK